MAVDRRTSGPARAGQGPTAADRARVNAVLAESARDASAALCALDGVPPLTASAVLSQAGRWRVTVLCEPAPDLPPGLAHTDAERDLLELFRSRPAEVLSGPEAHRRLADLGRLHGLSTVSVALRALVGRGALEYSRRQPRGYRLRPPPAAGPGGRA